MLKKIAQFIFILTISFGWIFSGWPQIFNFPNKVELVSASTTPYVGFFSPESSLSTAANVSLNLRQPDPRSGDLMVAAIAIRPAASTVTTPSGWTALGSWTGTDGGAEGADTGSVGFYWFYKLATGSEGNTNVLFAEVGATSIWEGTIMQFRSASGTYDLSSGGYSVNGDTTDWSGTPDGSVSLTEGDIVLIAAAQNGDSSNTSGWGLPVTGITAKSTVLEHSEWPTAGGNDLEMAIAETMIRTGTNTADPTVLLTQSLAVSGTVSILRVRQGSGSNRTDTWVRSAGAQAIGAAGVNVYYPDHDVGDMLILLIGNRYSTGTPTNPSGWTLLSKSYTGGSGSNAANSGTTRMAAYYKEVTSSISGAQNLTITGSNSTIAQIFSIHKDNVTSWVTDVDGGSDNTANTSWSVTGTGIDLDSTFGGDIVLVGSAVNTALYNFTSYVMSATGITFGGVTQSSEYKSGTGADMTLTAATGRVTGGSGSGALTFTKTSSGTVSGAPSGASIFVKILGLIPSFTQSGYRFFGNTDTLDVGSALASQDTAATLSSAGSAFRLRMLVHIGDSILNTSGQNFKLQFAEKSGTCDTGFSGETYADVTGSTLIAYNNNATPSDGAGLTSNANDPTHSGHTIVNQTYRESNNFTNAISAISAGEDGKWDFSLIDNSAPSNTSYCFRIVKSDGTTLDTYNNIPEVATSAGGSLSVDIVDSGDISVISPTAPMTPTNFSFSDQTSTGTFGTSSQKIRVDNGTGTATWTLSLAADSGSTAFWDGTSADYDFNDPTASAIDGGDADSLGGQMTINPTTITITPEGGCTSTNVSGGSSSAFSEGVTDSVTLASASAGADTGCYWDLTDISISQTIPAEQPADSYSIDMTLSIIAS